MKKIIIVFVIAFVLLSASATAFKPFLEYPQYISEMLQYLETLLPNHDWEMGSLNITGDLNVDGTCTGCGTGSNPFDQDLNTTDDVKFDSVVATGFIGAPVYLGYDNIRMEVAANVPILKFEKDGSALYKIDHGGGGLRFYETGKNVTMRINETYVRIGDVKDNKHLYINGNLHATDNVIFMKNLTVEGSLIGGSPLKIAGGLKVSGDIVGSIPCTNITGGTDVDFCTDATGEGGSGWSGYEIISSTSASSSADKVHSVDCSAGKNVTGGGCYMVSADTDLAMQYSYPLDYDTWTCKGVEGDGVTDSWTITAYVICAEVS